MESLKGKLILVVGSSGSGKSELMSALQRSHPEYVYPISATTRAPRPSESDGVKYHFLTENEFDKAIDADEFIEWASFGGRRYGTLKSEILPPLREGKLVVREVEVQGARRMLELIPRSNLRIVFINGGDWETLKRRISRRSPMDDSELERRRSHYEDEMTFEARADRVIVNEEGEMERSKEEFIKTIEHFA